MRFRHPAAPQSAMPAEFAPVVHCASGNELAVWTGAPLASSPDYGVWPIEGAKEVRISLIEKALHLRSRSGVRLATDVRSHH